MSRPTFVRYEEIEERLKKEKTIVSEPQNEEFLLKQLCPSKIKKKEIEENELKFKIIQKFMKDISGKLKSNQNSIVFDECRSRIPGENQIIFFEDLLEVLVPIRRPTGSELQEICPAYFIIKCPGKDKSLKYNNEMSESLWEEYGMEIVFSSEKLCKVMYTILKDAFQGFVETTSDYINLVDFVMDSSTNVLILDLEFNKEYLNIKFNEKVKKSDAEDDEELTKSTPDMGRFVQLKKDKSLESFKRIYDIKLKVRLIPSVTVSVKEKLYIISQKPNKQANNSEFDLELKHSWFQDCWWKEQLFIDKITAADKCTRLSTYAGIRQICRLEPDLQFLTSMHLRHNLILQLDQNLDNMTSSWQRITFFQCFCDQLECLRDQLKNKSIVNYFNLQHNLLDRDYIDNGMLKKALQRLDMLLRSKSSLLRCIEDAI